jgi:pimeloyl-ACP methyl ester carboxylesterase
VLYDHGLPGAQCEWVAREDALHRTGVRLVALERPGFGRSDDVDRTVASWPSDVADAADRLGIERFGLVGYSCGAPFALASALRWPQRITGLALVSAVAPRVAPRFREGLGRTARTMIPLARHAPWLARSLLSRARAGALRNPDKFDARFARLVAEPDRAHLARPGVAAQYRRTFLDATDRGVAGYVREYALWGSPWGLDLGRLGVPAVLYHGDADATIPTHHSAYLAKQLPGARLVVWPGAGHLTRPERWLDVLTALG